MTHRRLGRGIAVGSLVVGLSIGPDVPAAHALGVAAAPSPVATLEAPIVRVLAPTLAPLGSKSSGGGKRRGKSVKKRPKPEPIITSPVSVPDCIPANARPPAGAAARLRSVGTPNRNAIATYVRGMTLIHCDKVVGDEGWDLIGEAALAGYRPAIRALSNEISDRPSLVLKNAKYVAAIRKEAGHNSGSALVAMATLAESGTGMKVDPAAAARWYTIAVRKGNQKAMERVAVAQALGRGMKADRARAQKLVTGLKVPARGAKVVARIVAALAADRSSPDVERELNAWHDFARGRYGAEYDTALQKEYGRAIKYAAVADAPLLVQRGLALGVVEALSIRGQEIVAGPDPAAFPEGVAYLARAALRDDSDAVRVLGRLCVSNTIDVKVAAAALEGLRAAGNAGSMSALMALAVTRYFAESGAVQNPTIAAKAAEAAKEAAGALERAAASGVTEAQERLAILSALQSGDIAAKAQAQEWLDRSNANERRFSGVINEKLKETKATTP